jgi:hypothetical protein
MKIFKRLCCCVLSLLLSVYFTNCTSSTDPNPTIQVVSCADVWFSDTVNLDSDIYYSYARLNLNLDVSAGGMNIFVLLDVRVTDPLDTAGYHFYSEKETFRISGSTRDDSIFFSIGYPNTELPEGSYDFRIQVFKETDPENPILELAGNNDDTFKNVLTEVPLEESLTDNGLVFSDVIWTNQEYYDPDDYFSSIRLNFDLDVNRGSVEVFVKISVRLTDFLDTSPFYLYFQSSSFIINGRTSDDWVYFTVGSPNEELPEGRYDFLIQVFEQSHPEKLLAELAPYNDDHFGNILTGIPLEKTSTDAQLSINSYWIDRVDNDGDGYASQVDLVIDVNIIPFMPAAIFIKVYQKNSDDSTYNLQFTSDVFTINGNSWEDAISYTMINFPHGFYDLRIEVFFNEGHFIEDIDEAGGSNHLHEVGLELTGED